MFWSGYDGPWVSSQVLTVAELCDSLGTTEGRDGATKTVEIGQLWQWAQDGQIGAPQGGFAVGIGARTVFLLYVIVQRRRRWVTGISELDSFWNPGIVR